MSSKAGLGLPSAAARPSAESLSARAKTYKSTGACIMHRRSSNQNDDRPDRLLRRRNLARHEIVQLIFVAAARGVIEPIAAQLPVKLVDDRIIMHSEVVEE